ncbi:NAD(P)/FAD-dependent oxidoreductase [Roseomonas sp. HF4]|uniref:NAD(P)/FAD-dependent oxidoreductase n=1 Tax=Roseomonas sp. HF4 TaxID=2562313 RepID=UPI0010C0C8E6|nr:FAD-dependent oxidoreductase [Roseomonas sp. HF4]
MSGVARDADVLVAGGGPAGAACAIRLARAGRHVLLVEREAGPREKVCGEFLGADAQACLAALGIDLPALGAVRITEARIARRAAHAAFALPFAAWGLPRSVLDEALLRAAAAAGATVLRGRSVTDATREGDAWCLRLADGARLRAPHLVLATGKRPLRGFARAGATEGWIGAKLHLRLRAPLDAVVLLPFAGSYAGLQPSGDGMANLCAALAPGAAGEARDAERFVGSVRAGSPLAAALLGGAQPCMPRPLTVAGVPYGFLHRDAPAADPALWRLGDQFAVIPSFLGDGMAMALAGGIAAGAAIVSGGSAPDFHAGWRRQLAGPMRIAGLTGFVLRRAPGLFADAVATVPGLARLVARRTRVIGAERPVPAAAVPGRPMAGLR